MIKTGPGGVRLAGPAANTYTDVTEVRDGRLELSKSDATAGPRVGIAGDLQISSSANSTTEVRLNRDNLTADDATVSVRQAGKTVRPVVNLNGFSDTIGALNLAGGLVDTSLGSAVLTLNGDVTAQAAELGTGFVSASISGTLGLGPRVPSRSIALAAA
jgi:autotransporter-associated beta strand protein